MDREYSDVNNIIESYLRERGETMPHYIPGITREGVYASIEQRWEDFIVLFLNNDQKCLEYLRYAKIMSPVFDFIFEYELEFLTLEQIKIYFDFIKARLFVSSSQVISVINLLPRDEHGVLKLVDFLKQLPENIIKKAIEQADDDTLYYLMEFIWFCEASCELQSVYLPLLRRRGSIDILEFYLEWDVVLLAAWEYESDMGFDRSKIHSYLIRKFNPGSEKELNDATFEFIELLVSNNLLASIPAEDLEKLLAYIEEPAFANFMENENLQDYVDLENIKNFRREFYHPNFEDIERIWRKSLPPLRNLPSLRHLW